VENGNGVRNVHQTEIVLGELLLEIDGQPSQTMVAGESIELPIDTGYAFTVLSAPAHIQCHYLGNAAQEIEHLQADRGFPRVWLLEVIFDPADWEGK